MAEINRLQHLYYQQKVEYGLATDQDVVDAWSKDPIKYKLIFATRLSLLAALQKYYNL